MKVVLMGDVGVGKATIMTQLLTGTADPDKVQSNDWQTYKTVSADPGAEMTVMITSVSTDVQDARRSQIVGEGDAFLAIYSISNLTSFQNINTVKQEILETKNVSSIPIIVIGNKLDLSSERKVESAEGNSLASSWGAPFMEISALENESVVKVFQEIINLAKEGKKAPKPEKGKKKCCTVI